MTKEAFILELRDRLAGISKEAIDSRIEFYSEMIDDAMEEGLSEEEAVSKVGSIDEVVEKILEETPLRNIVKEKTKNTRKPRGWEIVLLIVGFPLWFPLLLVAGILALVAYLLIWVFVLVLYIVVIACAAGSIAGIMLAVINVAGGNPVAGGIYIGCAIAGAGLAILMYYASIYITKLVIKVTKKSLLGVKRSFVGGKKNE
ncbi:MAG: DUF1700 domain-containing protein [Bacilli bacterium]|nr:DUF1700 domain-containing protein [Bacilli bacterium]